MDNHPVKKDLVEAILELREEVERRLQANKYYVAMNNSTNCLPPSGLEVIEAKVNPTERPTPEAEAAPVPEPEGTSEKFWTGLVQESVVEGEALRAF